MSIRDLTEECLDELAEESGGDAMEILGFLPVNVIGELVGVPRSDWNYFRPLVNDGVANLEASPTLEELKASHAAFTEMGEYFRQLCMKEKESEKRSISALIEVEESGDRISEDEVVSTVILLFAAGMETTQIS